MPDHLRLLLAFIIDNKQNSHCGIISSMTDPNLDETIPTNPDQDLGLDRDKKPPQDLEETTPTPVSDDSQNQEEMMYSAISDDPGDTPEEEQPAETKTGSPRWRWFVIGGIGAILLIALLSGWSGYNSGINLRTDAQATQESVAIEEQYVLALQEIEEGEYYRARQRLEYIIQINPSFPGVTDKLSDVLLLINATATPSPVPTPTLTPTPDTRQADEVEKLFSQAQGQLANDDTSGAIETLLLVRKLDPGYQMVAIDGMLFIALRNRGLDKISILGELEEGVYDLSLAERFGPLDTEAEGFLIWAKMYITGASFWELDWSQAVYYFSQVAPQLPSLRDGSGWTAKERYRLALYNFGNTLMAANDPCQASEQYSLSLSLAYDPDVELVLVEANNKCEGGKPDKSQSDRPPDELPSEPPDELPPGPTEEPTPYP